VHGDGHDGRVRTQPEAGAQQTAYDQAKSALGVAAPDDRTLVIQLTHPAPYFPTIAFTWVFYPVKQEIAMTVKGDKVSCSINNKVVATYDRSALVTTGKLKSTDGVYGIRFAHNTDAIVTGLKASKAP